MNVKEQVKLFIIEMTKDFSNLLFPIQGAK